jgi:hypothetical protein
MKKIIYIGLTMLFSNLAIAGSGDHNKGADNVKVVTGKVIDKTSGEEIAGAEIKINDKVLYSDLNGNFSAVITAAQTEASVSSIAYNDKKISIDPFSYTTLVVELESR